MDSQGGKYEMPRDWDMESMTPRGEKMNDLLLGESKDKSTGCKEFLQNIQSHVRILLTSSGLLTAVLSFLQNFLYHVSSRALRPCG